MPSPRLFRIRIHGLPAFLAGALFAVAGLGAASTTARGEVSLPCGYDVEFYVLPNCGIFGRPTFAYGVNDAGVTVGEINGCPEPINTKGFVWWTDGSVTVLDDPAFTSEEA